MTTSYTTGYTASGALRGLALATTLAGTLDLLAAFAIGAAAGTSPAVVLGRIAGGVIGAAALLQPVAGTLLGLLLHFLMVGLMANAYGIAAARLPAINRHWLASGVVFGAILWVVMTIDGQISHIGIHPSEFGRLPISIALLGVPIAWIGKLSARWRA